MTHQSIYIIYEGDSYEVQLLDGQINSIWRVRDNDSHNPPEFVQWPSLPIDLQSQIENLSNRKYGTFAPN